MLMKGEIVKKIIDKYLSGEASADEINDIEKWYGSFDSQTKDLYIPDTPELQQAVAKGFTELKLKLGIK